MTYSIIQFQKVKTSQELSALVMHNLRLKGFAERDESIDQTRASYNKTLINRLNVAEAGDLNKNLQKYYKDKQITIKKDSVLMLDFVLTTSPEYWGEWSTTLNDPKVQQKLDTWVQIQCDFMEKEFPGLVQLATLHLDEKTPHIHFQISTEEEKTVTTTNRHGTSSKVKHVLNAKRWPPDFFMGLVDRHAEASKHLGLKRGETHSRAKKTPLKQYKVELNKTLNKQKEILTVYQDSVEEYEATTSAMLKLKHQNQVLMKKVADIQKENSRLKGSTDPDYLSSLGL